MSIKKANSLFKKGDIDKALKLYEELILKTPELKSTLEVNIYYCKKKLNIPIECLKKEENKNDLKKLLSMNIENILTKKKLPDFVDIQLLLTSIDKPKKEDIDSILKCVLSSPFQKNLLSHTRKLLVKFKLKNVLYEVETGLNIATMIKLATDKKYWLQNKEKLKKEFNKYYEIEKGYKKLLGNYFNTTSIDNEWNLKNYSKNKNYNNNIYPKKSIAFGTILLNEEKFIAKNLYTNYYFCDSWILIEGTCLGYPTHKVTSNGLSKDNSSKIIEIFPDPDNKIKYIQYGWTKCDGEDAKSELRNEYLKYIHEDFLVVIDADEFYLKQDLIDVFKKFDSKDIYGVTLPQVHFWKTTKQYITGEYYDISHTRIYRNINGMKYIRNHNFPEINAKYVHDLGHYKFKRTQTKKDNGYFFEEPSCFHMGFAKDYDDMKDKSDYYVNRGEDKTRQSTTASRAAWFNDNIPEKCKIKKWTGSMPFLLKEIK